MSLKMGIQFDLLCVYYGENIIVTDFIEQGPGTTWGLKHIQKCCLSHNPDKTMSSYTTKGRT